MMPNEEISRSEAIGWIALVGLQGLKHLFSPALFRPARQKEVGSGKVRKHVNRPGEFVEGHPEPADRTVMGNIDHYDDRFRNPGSTYQCK